MEDKMKNAETELNRKKWWEDSKLLLRILIISLSVNFMAIIFFVGRRYYYSKAAALIEKDITYLAWRDSQTEMQRSLPVDSNDIVFIGDSITQGFPTQEMFNNFGIKNRGISYNNSFDIVKRIESIASGKPKKIFLLVGINDIMRGITSDSTLSNIHIIISTIKLQSPETKIYVQSVFPTAKEAQNKLKDINDLNEKIKDYCQANKLIFLNFYPSFLAGTSLDTTLTYDGVHLNAKGYFLWKELLYNHIKE